MPKNCGGDCLAAPCAFCDGDPAGREDSTPRKPRMKPGDAGFYRGVLLALTVRYEGAGIDLFYDGVVGAVNRDNLLRVARRAGKMRSSGLSEYMRAVHAQGRT